ncbi:conserved hypothetical protein, secreted [Beggiatoa sp. PS]|nr:conserved hypothetical protein, secreted [Beggiatoa sp. PS]
MKVLIKLILMCFLLNHTVLAATGQQIGPFRLFSELGINFLYDDNILQQPSDEISSFVTQFEPKLELRHQQRANTYVARVESDIGRYIDSSSDDYEDWLLLGEGDWQLTRRANFSLRGSYQQEHDPRGSTDRVSTSNPQSWHATALSGKFTYGRQRAKAQIETELGHFIKRYEDFSVDDINRTEFTTRFYYRVLPKIRLFLEAGYTLTDYELASSTQDNNLFNYSIGVKWDATKKTMGRFKIGYLAKKFDSDEREEFSGINWELGLQWIPINHSTVNISTGQRTNDATGIGDYLLTRDFSIGWIQQWKRHLSTTIDLSLAQTNFGGNTARLDDVNNLNLAVNYDWHKWLSFSVGLQLMQRDSTEDTSDFDKMIWLIALKMTI